MKGSWLWKCLLPIQFTQNQIFAWSRTHTPQLSGLGCRAQTDSDISEVLKNHLVRREISTVVAVLSVPFTTSGPGRMAAQEAQLPESAQGHQGQFVQHSHALLH